MDIGDKVVRRSHGKDVTFEIVKMLEIDREIICLLKGYNMRIEADAPISDLVLASRDIYMRDDVVDGKINDRIKKLKKMRRGIATLQEQVVDDLEIKEIPDNTQVKKSKKKGSKESIMFGRPGRVLHIDGDERYLKQCLGVYKELGIIAYGETIKEDKQAEAIVGLVKKYKADIVVLTGHDGMISGNTEFRELSNYRNSKYYIEAVKNLREYEADYDKLVIFAGACQSCYECLLEAGANFASSPDRVLIHCLDPVFVCERVAYTNIDEVIDIRDVIQNTITGFKGIGGLETRGKYRDGYPINKY